MGKVKKEKVIAVEKLDLPNKDKKIAKQKVTSKKTLKEKIRKSLGLKSPKKSSLNVNKNEQSKLVEAVEATGSVQLTKKSKKYAVPNESLTKQEQKVEGDNLPKKLAKGKKRKQTISETEEVQTPGRYVLNRKNKVSKKKEKNSYKELEEKYKIDANTVKSGFAAVQKLLEEESNKHSKLFEEEQAIYLQITAVKVPKCPTRVVRLPLKHSLFSESSEICLIVPDVKHIPVKETEQVADYYETFLANKDIKNIKTVLPLYQLRTDYGEFELKRRLVELYDVFLVDGRICGKVAHTVGKIFYNKRKLPVPIKLNSLNLKEAIDKALLKTPLHLHSKGDSFVVQICHSNMDEDRKIDNFWSVVQSLEKEFPGGWENVRSLHLKGASTTSVPVYLTLAIKNSIQTPVLKPKRPKAFKPVSDELSTQYNRTITVYPSGDVVTKRLTNKDDLIEHNDSDNEIDKISKDDDGYMENKQKKGKRKAAKKLVEKDEDEEQVESNNEELVEYTKEELSYLQEMEDKKKNKKQKKQKAGNKKTKTKQ